MRLAAAPFSEAVGLGRVLAALAAQICRRRREKQHPSLPVYLLFLRCSFCGGGRGCQSCQPSLAGERAGLWHGNPSLKSPAARLPRSRNGVAPIMQRRDEARASVRCKCGACPAAYGDFMELFSEKRGVKTGAFLSFPSASVFPNDVSKNKRHFPRLARMAQRGKVSSGRLRPRALAFSLLSANHWMQVASPMTP